MFTDRHMGYKPTPLHSRAQAQHSRLSCRVSTSVNGQIKKATREHIIGVSQLMLLCSGNGTIHSIVILS